MNGWEPALVPVLPLAHARVEHADLKMIAAIGNHSGSREPTLGRRFFTPASSRGSYPRGFSLDVQYPIGVISQGEGSNPWMQTACASPFTGPGRRAISEVASGG